MDIEKANDDVTSSSHSSPQPDEEAQLSKALADGLNTETNGETAKSKDDPQSELSADQRQLLLSLRDCSWEQLQQRFVQEMDQRSEAEMALQKETADLLGIFMAWSQTTVFHDEDRAYKRFKTRMLYAQGSESKLDLKKKHYSNVVKAFESALALLRDD